MPLVGFKPTISAGEWPQTYALDCMAIGTGLSTSSSNKRHYNIMLTKNKHIFAWS